MVPIDSTIYQTVLTAILVLAPVTYIALFFIPAPYGRHSKPGWGPAVNTRVSWIIMESPSVLFFAFCFAMGIAAWNTHPPLPLIFAVLWLAHYIHRTFIYPFQIRASNKKPTAWAIVGMGFVFNLMNSFVNGTYISSGVAYYTWEWLYDPRFIGGVLLFITGFVINRHSDFVLANLRKPGETEYKIPQKGLFRWLTSPNYFGELVQWCGWALATWSLAGVAFAVFTAANLIPRAIAHHKWYKAQFPNYPKNRRAVIPFLL